MCTLFPKATTRNHSSNHKFNEKDSCHFGRKHWTGQIQVLKNLQGTRVDKELVKNKYYDLSNSKCFSLIFTTQEPKLKGLDSWGHSLQELSFKTLRKVIFKLKLGQFHPFKSQENNSTNGMRIYYALYSYYFNNFWEH